MGLEYKHLDDVTRRYMLEEIEFDATEGTTYVGKNLNDTGCESWPRLIREAAESGNDDTLAEAIKRDDCLKQFVERRKPKGGTTMVAVRRDAAEMLAEGEFNRFYIRALCRRAIDEGVPHLVACRAKEVREPRPESQAKIGERFDPQTLLNDLRVNTGVDTALGLPSGPMSGLCVTLPD